MKRLSPWIRLLVSSSLILLLLYTVNLSDLSGTVNDVNPFYLLLAFGLALVDRVLMAYKWNILLKAKSITISLKTATFTYLTATFLGLWLPATVGGDALRAYAVSSKGYNISDVISSIVVERLLGLIALMIFVLGSIILSVFVFGQNFFDNIWDLFWIIAIILIGTLLLLWTSMNEIVVRRLYSSSKNLITKIFGDRPFEKLKKLYLSYLKYQHNKTLLGVFLMLSSIENLFPILWSFFLSLSIDLHIPLLYFFILIPIVLVLRRLPISVDGLGIHEGAFVFFLSLIGVDKSAAFVLGIVTHIFAIAVVLPGGVLYALRGLTLKGYDDQPDSDMVNSRKKLIDTLS